MPLPAYLTILTFALLLSGCGSTIKSMQPVPTDSTIAAPDRGKSLIIFMRPSAFGAYIQSSIFEIRDGASLLIGTVTAEKKIAYQVAPGEHLFMVANKTADFMTAQLKVNKTYYVRIAPVMGRETGLFSIRPISINRLYSEPFTSQLKNSEWAEKTAGADEWLQNNMPNIQSKYKKHYAKWQQKTLSERPGLLPSDGK